MPIYTNDPCDDGLFPVEPSLRSSIGIGPKITNAIDAATKDWLDKHPEATTTVEDNSITNKKLKDGSVNSRTIENESITTDDIADLAVTTPKIANGAVTADKIVEATADGLRIMSPSQLGVAKVGAGLAMNDGAIELDGSGDIATAVTSWLNAHPEATTTVQDGSVTDLKLVQNGGILSRVSDFGAKLNGFKLLNVGNENAKHVYSFIKKSYVKGDLSDFDGYRIGIIANSGYLIKRMVMIKPDNTSVIVPYNATTGYMELVSNGSTLVIDYDWDASGDTTWLNTYSYEDAQIEYAGINTVMQDAAEMIDDGMTVVLNDMTEMRDEMEQLDFRTKVWNRTTLSYDLYIRGTVTKSSPTAQYSYTESTSSYGFFGYAVEEGKFYRITVDNIRLYRKGVALMWLPSVLSSESSITEDNVYVWVSTTESDAFPRKSYSYLIQAPADGYIYQYAHNGTGELDKIEALEYTSEVGDVNDYCLGLREMIDGSKEKPAPHVPSIVCSGSSITWGGGLLDGSMVGHLDNYLKNQMLSTVMHPDMVHADGTVITHEDFYKRTALLVSGVDKEVSFELYGDEIAICHAKRRSNDYGVMEVYADNTLIGTFDNRNSILSDEETFTGEQIRSVELAHPCTFNHRIYINGSTQALESVVINSGGAGATPTGDAFVYRKSTEDGGTCHAIEFSESLGNITSVRVAYDYGRMIAYARNTRGQLDTEYQNESHYGEGSVAYDPASPAGALESGLEFRAVDERAFFVHKFDTAKLRQYRIRIVGGTNPYMLINFASNRFYNLMNAGIGGWRIDLLGNSNVGINKYTQFGKYVSPQIIYQESETNDDWHNPIRRIGRDIGEVTLEQLRLMRWLEVRNVTYNVTTDKYRVLMATGIISAITPTSLTSPDIVGTSTEVGDIARIGTYHGDIRQVTCREISSVDTTTGTIEWVEPLHIDRMYNVDSISDLVGAEVCIRNLDDYRNNYKSFIEKVNSIWGGAHIIVVDNGLPNLWCRQLWGYDVIHRKLCSEYGNVEYLDARKILCNGMDESISGVESETVTNTGDASYELDYDYSRHAYWQGIKVLVDGVDVYGKDAYVEGTYSYYLNDGVTGNDCNKVNAYVRGKASTVRKGKMRLVFTRNVPSSGQTIEVQFADSLWSNDYCHPSDWGAYLYAHAYISALKLD